MAWVWIAESVVLAIHEAQLAEHGGMAGVREENLLASALARPHNLDAYGDKPDVAAVAEAYAFAIARNHPFFDGNKRTAFVLMELFLYLNGRILEASDGDCITTMLALAAGHLSEENLAAWLREHSKTRELSPR